MRKLVNETGLIVCQYTVRRTQYDRLSQQQLSFLLVRSKQVILIYSL